MGMNMYGFSIGGAFSHLFLMVTKLLIFLLVIILIYSLFAWVKENFFVDCSKNKFMAEVNKDPILRVVAAITGLIVIFSIISGLLINPMFGLIGIFFVLIKLLIMLFVISLIVAFVQYIIKECNKGNLNIFECKTNPSSPRNSEIIIEEEK